MALAAALAIGAALLVVPWFGHFDDTDSQTYQVVARKMAERHLWLDPAYLDHLYPRFREHLPFGFWPFAAVDLFSERSARAVAALFSFSTLVLTGAIALRLLGIWSAVLSVLVLGATESFFRYGGATRLDPLLVLCATAAALPFLFERVRPATWACACLLAAAATLVKGPFGLVPLFAAGCARSLLDRSTRPALQAATLASAASIPFLAFLGYDAFVGRQGWWEVYFKLQMLGSASGARQDGSTKLLFPFASVAGRFWPGLPLAIAAALFALRREADRNLRLVVLFALSILVFLCLPGRKVWNHALIAYPALALVAGGAALPIRAWLDRHAAPLATALAAVAAATILAAPRLGAPIDGAPCVGAAELAPALDRLGAGDPVLVVSPEPDWKLLASLAAERRLEPVPMSALPDAGATGARIALIRSPAAIPPGWIAESAARGWTLLRNGSAR